MKIVVFTLVLLAARVVSAQEAQWPHCAQHAPTIIDWADTPHAENWWERAVVHQGAAYVMGWAFNWITGQQPRAFAVHFETWSGAIVPVETVQYPLLWRKDVSDYFAQFTSIWIDGPPQTRISEFTGYALYFKTWPPLDTQTIVVTMTDPFCPSTTRRIAVTVIP